MIISQATLDALRTGYNAQFKSGLGTAPSKSELLCTTVNSSTKIETYGFLGDLPVFRKWLGDKRIRSLSEKAYQLANDDFEATIGIHKHKLDDDNLGLYGPIVQGWGQDAGNLKDQLNFAALGAGHERPCFDGQNFFDTDHPVGDNGDVVSNVSGDDSGEAWFLVDLSKPLKPILYQNRKAPTFNMVTDPQDSHVMKTGEFLMGAEARGAAGFTYWQLAHRCTGPLDKAHYEAAKLAMRSLKNDEGEPLGIKPTHIVVGVSNVAAAKELFKQTLANGESNTLYNDVITIEADRLP